LWGQVTTTVAAKSGADAVRKTDGVGKISHAPYPGGPAREGANESTKNRKGERTERTTSEPGDL